MQVLGNDQTAGAAASAYPHNRAESLPVFRRLCSLGENSLILALASPFLALTRASVQKFLLAVVILDIPFQCGTHLFYNESVEDFGAMGGLSISSVTLALVGLYFAWFIQAAANRTPGTRRQLHLGLPLLVYLVFIGISVLVAQDVKLAVFEACLFLESYLLYLYVSNQIRTREDVRFMVTVLLVGGLVESLVMIILSFTGEPSTMWWLPTHIHVETSAREGFMRIGGTVGSPNTASSYLIVLLSTAGGWLFTNLGRLHKILASAVIALGSVALILTFSRGGWMALATSLILFGFFLSRRRGLSLRGPIAILVILTLLYLPFHNVISARLFGEDKGSAASRIPLMYLAFRIFADNPVLGVGANNFSVAMGPYLTAEFRRPSLPCQEVNCRQGFVYAVHDKYLLVLCETGIGGLAAFLAFLFAALRRGWHCWNFRDSFLSPLALGFLVGIAGHMVHMNVDIFRGRPMQQMIWLVAALLVAMHRVHAKASVSEISS
jgi:putative inorganic carbon (HCO3(-)) transporter